MGESKLSESTWIRLGTAGALAGIIFLGGRISKQVEINEDNIAENKADGADRDEILGAIRRLLERQDERLESQDERLDDHIGGHG